MIFVSRRKRGSDPFLERKIQLFFLGAVLALVGIALDSSILVGLAALALLGGMVLRFARKGEEDAFDDGGRDPDPPGEDEKGEGDPPGL